MFTTSFQGLVLLLSRPSSKDPSVVPLIALAITSYVMVIGIPIMLERISVHVKGFKPSCSLVV